MLQLVSAQEIQSLLDRPLGSYRVGGPWSARAVLERLVEFDTWAAGYGVRIDV